MSIALPSTYALAAQSRNAEELTALWAEWSTLRDESPRPTEFAGHARSLAARFVTHRDELFRANAVLQGDDPLDEQHDTPARIEANQQATKLCTVALSELTEALGLASEGAARRGA